MVKYNTLLTVIHAHTNTQKGMGKKKKKVLNTLQELGIRLSHVKIFQKVNYQRMSL